MSMPKFECSNLTIYDAIASILKSIALEEAALSHIINAEGELLQSLNSYDKKQNEFVKINDSITMVCNNQDHCQDKFLDKCLQINQSVNTVINSVSKLETLLLTKLEVTKSIIDDNPCLFNNNQVNCKTNCNDKHDKDKCKCLEKKCCKDKVKHCCQCHCKEVEIVVGENNYLHDKKNCKNASILRRRN